MASWSILQLVSMIWLAFPVEINATIPLIFLLAGETWRMPTTKQWIMATNPSPSLPLWRLQVRRIASYLASHFSDIWVPYQLQTFMVNGSPVYWSRNGSLMKTNHLTEMAASSLTSADILKVSLKKSNHDAGSNWKSNSLENGTKKPPPPPPSPNKPRYSKEPVPPPVGKKVLRDSKSGHSVE